jgi:hypothetical protein
MSGMRRVTSGRRPVARRSQPQVSGQTSRCGRVKKSIGTLTYSTEKNPQPYTSVGHQSLPKEARCCSLRRLGVRSSEGARARAPPRTNARRRFTRRSPAGSRTGYFKLPFVVSSTEVRLLRRMPASRELVSFASSSRRRRKGLKKMRPLLLSLAPCILHTTYPCFSSKANQPGASRREVGRKLAAL